MTTSNKTLSERHKLLHAVYLSKDFLDRHVHDNEALQNKEHAEHVWRRQLKDISNQLQDLYEDVHEGLYPGSYPENG